jgi:hypothetical protein
LPEAQDPALLPATQLTMAFPKKTPEIAAKFSRCLRLGWLLSCVPLGLLAARPSYDDAMRFGRELQQEYGKNLSKALISRLDDDSLRQQVFSVYGADLMDSEKAKSAWQTSYRPSWVQDLTFLDAFGTLVASRVLYLEGSRALECVLIGNTGGFQFITLWLTQKIDGRILINDYKFLGSSLTMGQRLRHVCLLMGAPYSAVLTDEEQDVLYRGESCRPEMAALFRAYSQNDLPEAYRRWLSLSPEVKALRIMQNFRDRMAVMGCEPAAKQLVEEYRQGKLLNSFLKFIYAHKAGDRTGTLAGLDAVIAESHHPPFLLAQKAEFLIRYDRASEAWTVATETYQLHPFCGSAYLAAMHAAAALKRPTQAVQALDAWSRLIPAEEIERIIQPDETFAELLRSAEFVAWKKRSFAPSTVSPNPEP